MGIFDNIIKNNSLLFPEAVKSAKKVVEENKKKKTTSNTLSNAINKTGGTLVTKTTTPGIVEQKVETPVKIDLNKLITTVPYNVDKTLYNNLKDRGFSNNEISKKLGFELKFPSEQKASAKFLDEKLGKVFKKEEGQVVPSLNLPTKEGTTKDILGKEVSKDINRKQIEAVVNTPIDIVNGMLNSLSKTEETFQKKDAKTSEKVAALASVPLSELRAIPGWMQFETILNVARENPITENVVKVLDKGLEFVAEKGSTAGSKFIDILPIEEQDKENLKPVASEIGGFVSQFLTMALLHKGIKRVGKIEIKTGEDTTLSWKDIKDITIGKDVDPAKVDAYKKLTQEGISFTEKLKEGDIKVKGETETVADFVMRKAQEMKNKAGLSIEEVKTDKDGKPVETIDPLIQEAKYKTTVNIQDKNDLEYLRRILSEDNIKDIQSGKMVNFRGTPYEDIAKVNLISETPKTMEQQLAGKIKEVKLKSDTFYHGTSAENARGIMETGFKRGSELPEETFRGGGYGKMQSSISLTETPKDASRFSTLTKNGEIVEAKLKPNSKVVSIEGVEDAVELEDYISYLKKQKVDAVYIGGGEKELVVINPKAITPTKSQLTDIWNKAQEKLMVEPELQKAFETKPTSVKQIQDKQSKISTRVRQTKAEIIRELKMIESEKKFLSSIREDIKKGISEKVRAAKKEQEDFLSSIREDIVKGLEKQKNVTRKQIGFLRKTKNLDGTILARAKKVANIEEWKKATQPQLTQVLEIMKQLEKGDKFLTDKQVEGLKYYTQTFNKDPRLVTVKEMQERFRERDEIMNGLVTSKIGNIGFPTVDIKEGHDVITRVVDAVDAEFRIASNQIKEVNNTFNELMKKAEQSRKQGLLKLETGKRIFKKLSGEEVELTKEELDAANFLKDYFTQARKDLNLQKYRKNYITNIEKTFLEKIVENGWDLKKTINSYKARPEDSIPVDVMLALDNIIGSEKFFRFALERKGGTDPTTNVRKILKQYSEILENKKALDQVLPEGQAAVQLLLQPKSAVWMKKYLQNLKGRGLDYNFRNGKGRWVAKVTDRIIDLGYVRLLALNYWSAIKNIVGGETNSFVYQDFKNYLTGKQRLLGSPKKAYKIITESGLLDGSYVDLVEQNAIQKGKKYIDLALYGGMEAAEYEIRGSYLLGELTKSEWETGKLTPERFRKILDNIAITQGLYTKVDSPLFVQTFMGRSVAQFSRWKITNSLLVRRLAKGAKAEYARGEYTGKNTMKLLKLFLTYGAFAFLAAEAGKAGYTKAKKVLESGTELVNVILNFPQEVWTALRDNPLYQTVDSVVFTIQELLSSIGIVEEPRKIQFRQGIEDTYFSAAQTLGLTEEKEEKKSEKSNIGLPELPKLPKLPKL